jgi:hypothetical protein
MVRFATVTKLKDFELRMSKDSWTAATHVSVRAHSYFLLIAENKSVTECWQQVFKMAAFVLDAQPGSFQRTYRNGGGGCPIIVTAHVHISERQCMSPISRCLFATLPAEGYRQAQFSKLKVPHLCDGYQSDPRPYDIFDSV